MHNTLVKQIEVHLGGVDKVPQEFDELFNDVSRTYSDFEGNMDFVQRSLDASHKKLTEINDSLRQYLEIIGVMLITLNTEGIVTLVNKRGTDVLGYEKEEVIGKKWFENFLLKEDIESTRDIFMKLLVMNISPAEYHENNIVTKKGEPRTIAWHNSVLKSKEGKVIGTLSSGEDITEKKLADQKIQEKNEELQKLNKLAIGREMRMIELKKKIRDLEEKVSKIPASSD